MTEPSDIDGDDAVTAAEYALRLLPPDERAAFAGRLAAEPALRAAVAAWEERFAALADEVEPVPPPPRLRARLSDELFGEEAPSGGLLRRLAIWRGLAFTGMAASVAMFALLLQDRWAPTPEAAPAFVADVAAEDASLRLVALFDAEAGTLRLNRLAGSVAAGRDFELWLVPPEQAPISLGVLPHAARATIRVPEALRDLVPGALLAVSDEPAGGSPTGTATGPVLAVGQVEAI